MKSKIVLNCFPPASTSYPSISLSILKAFMDFHGYEVNIKYWNLVLDEFQLDFLKNQKGEHMNLLPYINYIWVFSGKKLNKSNLKYQLLSSNPLWNYFGHEFTEKKMLQYANELEEIITGEISKMELGSYQIFGVTTKFYQWICGGIVAKKVKELFPQIKIVVGGLGTAEEALVMMENFEYYDYAIWGEGEFPLLHLCELLESRAYAEIPCLIFRNNENKPQASKSKKKEYFNLNSELYPDYSDFFTQNSKINRNDVSLPFEGSRGCHWRKCRFCYLNNGYRYRIKSNENKIKEIKHQIEKYETQKFCVVDNDFIGKDIKYFDKFLDELIKLKEDCNDFSIEMAEIITKNTNSSIIKKMALAGILNVQIGYESPSNGLLQKIKKKNTFASNLLFIKWAKYFSISVTGTNAIQGLLEETTDDIFEAIDNLFYLRFFLSNKTLKHRMSNLRINKSSPYFKDITNNNNLADWNYSFISDLLPDNFYNQADRYSLLEYSKIYSESKEWLLFDKIANYYTNSNIDYQLIDNKNIIHYREFFDNELINELVFENSLHWKILQSCNHHISSLNELSSVLLSSNTNDIISAIDALKCEGLLYHNSDFSEIVTPINTDIVL